MKKQQPTNPFSEEKFSSAGAGQTWVTSRLRLPEALILAPRVRLRLIF